jgi:hypothetical protein
MEGTHSQIISGTLDKLRVENCNGVDGFGVFEICVKSVCLRKFRVTTQWNFISVECNLVNQVQVMNGIQAFRPAVLEVFQTNPLEEFVLHLGTTVIWHEVTANTSDIVFSLRDHVTDEIIRDSESTAQIVMLYRRKR